MLSLSAAMFGMFFFVALFAQNVLDYSPVRAGLAFLWGSEVLAHGISTVFISSSPPSHWWSWL